MRIKATITLLALAGLLLLSATSGCDERDKLIGDLQDRNDDLTLEVSQLRASLAEANRDLGILEERRQQTERDISRLSREAQNLRNRQSEVERLRSQAEREKASVERQLATVRSFINEKDNLYGEIEDLKAAASRARTLAVELEQANSRYENLRDNAAREIDQLRDTVTKLTISIEAKEAEAEEGRRASDRIQQVEQTIAVMARSHPEYFVSLLEEYKSTPDADLIVWNDVALSYTGGIRSLGAELALTLPLAVLDYRGPIRLTYGSLEVTAISMTIDLDRGMAKIGFPDDRKLRDSMALNSSTSVLVSFGPEDNRSVLAFAIGEEEEKLGMTTVPFLLNEIRLGDLPVARKDASNRWALLQ
tara:strand:- start:4585 stop:5670 length:1086 start_codon:yes stop_codon:yes gene_type:complete